MMIKRSRVFNLIFSFFISITSILYSNIVLAAAPANYYNSVDSSSATALRNSLHAVIDDHIRFPYTSSNTDTWDILEMADEDQTNSSNITAIYRNSSYTKQGGGNNSYNREHSWPKSYGFPNDNSSNYPYTDAHHLFLANSSYNSSRGNKFFDDCNSGCTEKTTVSNDGRGGSGDSNWADSNSWQVWSQRKGDIARAMFYMDIRYEGGSHGVTGANEPDLRLTNSSNLIATTGGNSSIAYMGLLSTLLQWHADDPVDAIEQARNDIVFSFQENRNPFIDNPQWVACLYQNQCSSTPAIPTLNNGDTISNISAAAGQWRYYKINIPSNASNLQISISGSNGDADLYTQIASQPTTTDYNCRPYLNGSNESCSFASPAAGEYHIGVRAYEAFSGLSLNVNYSTGSSSGPAGGDTHSNLSGSQGQWRNFSITIPAGSSRLEVNMSGGAGDADLYVRHNALPTLSNYACRPWLTGNTENCTIDTPSTGTWYISIYGYEAYNSVDLEYHFYD